MGFYRLSILSTAFSHLLKILREPKIGEIYAERIWAVEEKSKKINKDIPYLFNKIKTIKRVKLSKRSFAQIFDFKKIVRYMIEEDVGDMAIGAFSILVTNGIIKEVLERQLNKKVLDDRFVLCFVKNTEAGKEDRTRQQISNIMRIQIDNFDLKIASLDLVGIYLYQDYIKDKQLNLLTEIQKNGKFLREIADQYFKEFITIQGVQKKIRAIKYYEIGSKSLPILKDIKVF